MKISPFLRLPAMRAGQNRTRQAPAAPPPEKSVPETAANEAVMPHHFGIYVPAVNKDDVIRRSRLEAALPKVVIRDHGIKNNDPHAAPAPAEFRAYAKR